ncbi:MAG TPA: proline dehydrogenase family protein [Chloroflexota bacterium]|nr:proline dehydrogenase family protein [Chloroflexota bacterium]
MSLWRDTVLGVATQPAVKQLVKDHALARPLRQRFVAGETIDDALAAARALNREGFRVSLDHLGEDVSEPAAADAAVNDYLALVQAIAHAHVQSGISIKLSQLGLSLDRAACQDRLERLLTAAQTVGVFVRIDMEGSAHTQETLDVLRAVWPRHHNVGVVLQAYLHRTGCDLEDVLALGATVRLCKGAYREPPTIAYQARDEVDAAYARLATRMLEAPNYAALATHDPALLAHARAEAARLGRPRDSFEFQMLYGVRRDLQQALVREGYRLRVYVPYGREWYPYLTRRLAERPGNLLFLVRSLWAEQRGNGARAA